jgi:hypothetical protein
MTRSRRLSRKIWVPLLVAAVAIGYFRFGIFSVGIGLAAFILYEMLNPPSRYRRFGPGQIEEAADNRYGFFGKSYREDEPDRDSSLHIGRNDPCPCGSGIKFKRCCALRHRDD